MARKKKTEVEDDGKNLFNDDLSAYEDYEEYFTKPKKVLVKRITKETEYTFTVNGTQQTAIGHPGDLEIIELTPNGNIHAKLPCSLDIFQKKYGKLSSQGKLKFVEPKEVTK